MSPLARPSASAYLARFPTRRLASSRSLYRIHRADRGPWWFSHVGANRFDLRAPRGTCYLAEQPLGAFVEVFRVVPDVPEAEVDARRISTLRAQGDLLLADCTARRARGFGVTAAIHSGPDYGLTQGWAAALSEAGFDGICYLVSHDPAQRFVGIALFGPAGSTDWPVESSEPIGADLVAAARRRFGIRVLPTPEH